MTPFYNQGKEFRFENDLDDVLALFIQSIDLYDSRVSERHRLIRLRATREFQSAYAELGSPDIWKGHKATTGECELIHPSEAMELHSLLSKPQKKMDDQVQKKQRQRFVHLVLAEYRATTDWICSAIHKQSIETLVHTLKKSNEEDVRQKALLKLVGLDMSFLTLPAAWRVIKKADIVADFAFKTALSKKLDPKRQGKAYVGKRQQYALFILSSLDYEKKSYGQWSKFFKYFNLQLGKPSGRPTESGFWSFEQWHTVKAAIKKYGVPKKAAMPGVRKKHTNES